MGAADERFPCLQRKNGRHCLVVMNRFSCRCCARRWHAGRSFRNTWCSALYRFCNAGGRRFIAKEGQPSGAGKADQEQGVTRIHGLPSVAATMVR